MRKTFFVILCLLVISTLAFADPDIFLALNGAGEAETLDPHYMYDTASGEIVQNLYDNLIMYNRGSSSEFLPMLATEVPSLDNGLLQDDGATYMFPIREGVKFHSGNIMTPKDVEYSFERAILFDRANGPQWMIIEALSGSEFYSIEDWFESYAGMAYSEAVDSNRNPTSPEAREKLISFYNEVVDPLVEVEDNTVVFRLAKAFGPFMQIVSHYAGWSAILDSEWCKANGAWDGNPDGWWKWHDLEPEETPLHAKSAGTGAFKLVEWDRAQQKIILERFEDYWRGPAELKTVIVWNIEEYSTRKAMLEAGDADFAYVPTQFKDQWTNVPGIKIYQGHSLPSITSFFMTWEIAEGSEYLGSGKLDGNGIPPDFFSDVHVRKGFKYCYNGEVLINDVVRGLGVLVPTDLPVGYLGFDETLPVPEFNLTRAAEEFKKAWNGQVWEKGFKVTVLYNSGNTIRQTAAEMFAYFISLINPKFKVETVGVQWPTYLASYAKGWLPAYSLGWLADYADPHNFIATYYASYGTYGAAFGDKYTEWAKVNLDPLIAEAVGEPDVERREQLYKDIQKIVVDNVIGFPLYNPTGFVVLRDWVDGWFAHPLRSNLYYYDLSKTK